MTKDDCLGAISGAYGGVPTWVSPGYWNIHVESKPPREIVLTSRFVEANVTGSGMTPDQLTGHLKKIPDTQWGTTPQGGLFLVLH